MTTRKVVCILAFCCVGVPLFPEGTVSASDAAPELAGLRDRWLSAMEELGVPGMAVVVVRDGQVILRETLGIRDPQTKQPVTPDTVFYIASCTKPFTAMAIVSLAEEGKLNLDAPVKLFLPRFQLADAELTSNITIRDLLSHSKGISGGAIVWLDAFTGQITEDRFYHHLKEVEIAGRPNYSNVHFTLLGRVIEAITGSSWKDVLNKRIFEPAGMKTATAYASKMYAGDAAVPCLFVDGKIVAAESRKTDRTMHAAGGTGASANDLARWLMLNLGGGEIDGTRIISEEHMREMVTPQATLPKSNSMFPDHTRTAFGLAWNLGAYRGEPLVEHGGGYTGTSAWITFMPEKGLGVAAVANSSAPLPFVAVTDVYDRLLDREPTDLLEKLKQRVATQAARQKERREKFGPNPGKTEGALSLPVQVYAGNYSNPQLGTIDLTMKNGELLARYGDLPTYVGSIGPDKIELGYEDDSPSPGKFIIKDGQVIAVRLRIFDEGDEIVFRRE